MEIFKKKKDDGTINVIKFEKTVLDLSSLQTKSIIEPKIQETSTIKVFKCLTKRNINLHNCNQDKKSLMDTKIEFNKRFGMPIFIPLMALICSFLLSSRKDKKIYTFNKYIYSLICIIILRNLLGTFSCLLFIAYINMSFDLFCVTKKI